MNVLVLNQQENLLMSYNIEAIKTLRGTFSADEIISTFTNFYFAHMIIDITALQRSDDLVTYQKLSIGLPIDKIILFIPPTSVVASNYFLSKLISMGYYNFTTNGEGVVYLLNNPNTYNDVAHLHQVDAMPPMPSTPGYGISNEKEVDLMSGRLRTLGIRNITDGAGASSLVYMIKKELEENYDMNILALEVNKKDFGYFREQNMASVDSNSVAREVIKAKDFNYVLVDLNDCNENVCDEILYLIEPSVIKLNKLLMLDRKIFSKLQGKKVIINKSTLSEEDVKEFSRESGLDIFYVLPPINDRERSLELNDMLIHIGMIQE
jgi:hypothetical protein